MRYHLGCLRHHCLLRGWASSGRQSRRWPRSDHWGGPRVSGIHRNLRRRRDRSRASRRHRLRRLVDSRRRPGGGSRHRRHLRRAGTVPELPREGTAGTHPASDGSGLDPARTRRSARAIPPRVPDPGDRRLHDHGDAAEGGIRPSASCGRCRARRKRGGNRLGSGEARRSRQRARGGAPPELGHRGDSWRARRPGRAGGSAGGHPQGPFCASQAPRHPDRHRVRPPDHRHRSRRYLRAHVRHGVRHRNHEHRGQPRRSRDRRAACCGRQRQPAGGLRWRPDVPNRLRAVRREEADDSEGAGPDLRQRLHQGGLRGGRRLPRARLQDRDRRQHLHAPRLSGRRRELRRTRPLCAGGPGFAGRSRRRAAAEGRPPRDGVLPPRSWPDSSAQTR